MSIYDLMTIGPLPFRPTTIHADYVQVEPIVNNEEDSDAQPYIQDGSFYIPARAWEKALAENLSRREILDRAQRQIEELRPKS